MRHYDDTTGSLGASEGALRNDKLYVVSDPQQHALGVGPADLGLGDSLVTNGVGSLAFTDKWSAKCTHPKCGLYDFALWGPLNTEVAVDCLQCLQGCPKDFGGVVGTNFRLSNQRLKGSSLQSPTPYSHHTQGETCLLRTSRIPYTHRGPMEVWVGDWRLQPQLIGESISDTTAKRHNLRGSL